MSRILAALLTFVLIPLFISSQTVLEVIPSGDLVCTDVVIGETVPFAMSNLCGANVEIHLEGIPVAVFTEPLFEYTFDQVGEYVIFCFAPPVGSVNESRVAITAACFRTVDQVVPTLEQWGVINLGLLLLIFGSVFLNNERFEMKSLGTVQ